MTRECHVRFCEGPRVKLPRSTHQYLLGWEAYRDKQPFDPSMMVHFRKRLSDSVLSETNEVVIQQPPSSSKDTDDEDGASGGGQQSSAGALSQQSDTGESEQEPPNSGSLLIHGCKLHPRRYPTDLSLLNEAPEKSEEIIDVLHRPDIGRTAKPRTYRRKARKDYLAVAKKRKPGAKRVRKAIGKQLRYIARNLKTIGELAPGRLVHFKSR